MHGPINIRYFKQILTFFFYNGATLIVGQGLLIIEDSWSHSDTPHSVGLLWSSDQLDAESFTWQHTTLTGDTSMPPVGFEPTTLASQPPQTHALDRATTGIRKM